jgi:CHASE3 domain sensor protein
MDKFEEMGRKLDEELTRLRKFVENDLAPETEKRTAQFLREVSEKLTEAAGWLEARRKDRAAPQEKEPAA